MKITETKKSRLKEVDFENLAFGEIFSDHMLSMEYKAGKWGESADHPLWADGDLSGDLFLALRTDHF